MEMNGRSDDMCKKKGKVKTTKTADSATQK